MSSRRRVRLERSTWAGEQRRRSPRIFALDFDSSNSGGQSSLEVKKEVTKRDNIKRKCHQDQPAASTIPEKQVLQDILDTLQRRDTYEIFAEPVDPDEVADYYEIIKEPMDFGTMRAKLHEGMYENLEQFKHDVFLITKNAMHFNSSPTIFFRQARGIDELAKRVFHVLQTVPAKFEPEFSGSRRRSARRPQIEAKVCRFSADVKPGKLTTNARPKDTPCSFPTTSVLERNSSTRTPKPASFVSPSSTRTHRARDGRRSNIIEIDRRCTYRPQSCYYNNNNNLFDPTIFNSKLINEQGFNYRESLLSFVEDLGPTAQMIATGKMQPNPPIFQNSGSINLVQSKNYQVPASNNWFQATHYQIPAPRAPNLSASDSIGASNSTMQSFKFADSLLGHCSLLETVDFKAEQQEKNAFVKERPTNNRLDYNEAISSLATGTNVLGAPKLGRPTNDRVDYNEASPSLAAGTNVASAPKRGRPTNDRLDYNEASSSLASAPKRGRPIQNHKSREFFSSDVVAKESKKYSNVSKKSSSSNAKPTSIKMTEEGRWDEDVRPVILALEHSQPNGSESKWKNKKTWTTPSTPKASHLNLSTQKKPPIIISPMPAPGPTVSGFAFGMEFLKAKLNQMNNQSSFGGIGRGLIEPAGSYYGYNNSYNCIDESLDFLDTNLALHL